MARKIVLGIFLVLLLVSCSSDPKVSPPQQNPPLSSSGHSGFRNIKYNYNDYSFIIYDYTGKGQRADLTKKGVSGADMNFVFVGKSSDFKQDTLNICGNQDGLDDFVSERMNYYYNVLGVDKSFTIVVKRRVDVSTNTLHYDDINENHFIGYFTDNSYNTLKVLNIEKYMADGTREFFTFTKGK